jgi:hypothetical protein
MRNRGIPDAHSVAAAAQVLSHNVEAEKGRRSATIRLRSLPISLRAS